MRTKQAFFFLMCCCLTLASGLGAQSANELKKQRQTLILELQKTNQALSKTKAERSVALSRLQLLQQQIEQRRALIATLHQEVAITDSSIARNEDVIHSLNFDLDKMRQEYAQTLRIADRTKLTKSWLTFLFSATGLNDAFRRFQYLRQYQDYRRKQGKLILATQATVSKRAAKLQEIKQEKEALLLSAEEQGGEIQKALNTQSSIVQALNSEEKKLLQKVEKQRKEEQALEKSIEAAISAEIAAARARERSSNPTSSGVERPSLGGNFASYKGKLTWPLNGKVVKKFGKQPHPDVPSVTINNGGIDISGGPNARVQAVFPGEVLSARLIPGYRQTLMIRHGNFYTVYSNLDRVLPQVGEEVEAGATIGFTSPNGEALHFELWKGKDRQDPAKWLKNQ